MASGGDKDDNPRPPKDMLSLLAYCADAGQNQSASSNPSTSEHVLDPQVSINILYFLQWKRADLSQSIEHSRKILALQNHIS